MVTQPSADSYAGFQQPETAGAEVNRIEFMFRQFMSRIWTSMLVKVVDVNTAGTLAAPALVDIQPMVHQIDGSGNSVPHATIYGVPCFRYQAGLSGVVLDPVAGDIGVALFAQRDISAVKANGAASAPGSRRRFNPADAIYLGGVLGLGSALERYIQLASGGITIVDPAQVTVTAPTVTVNASTSATLNSPQVNIAGSSGLKKIARDGDPVVGGVIQASSTKGFCG